MITFEHRILSEYKLKTAKTDVLANSIMSHRDPKGQEAKHASDFLDVLINELDYFYEKYSDILSNNGKRPYPRSRLPESKQWNKNVENFYENNPYRRRKN